MRILRFDDEVSREISQYGSVGLTLAPLAVGAGDIHIVCMRLAPGGHVGAHQAAGPQLFGVTHGEGWVQGGVAGVLDDERQPIRAGYAALWEAGEWHAAGTPTGMMALVIEGPTLTPAHLATLDAATS
jgi:quercetin dioxygenase-like cupin family protein